MMSCIAVMARVLLVAGVLTVFGNMPTTGQTNQPTFSELLARAKAQAAAGHRWAPAGDNMTETVLGMIDLVPTATAEQLSALSALLQAEETAPLLGEPKVQPSGKAPPPKIANLPPADLPPADLPPADLPPAALLPVDRPVSNLPPAPFPSSPAAAPKPPLISLPPSNVVPAPMPPPSPPSRARVAMLYARGLDAEHRGDFSAARRFYFSAAQQGDPAAARSLGRLFDADYLRQNAIGGLDPDPALARQWYERAVQLGDAEAGPLLQALSAR